MSEDGGFLIFSPPRVQVASVHKRTQPRFMGFFHFPSVQRSVQAYGQSVQAYLEGRAERAEMTLIGANGEDPACPRRQAPSKGENGLLGFG